MAKATWQVLALTALLGAVAPVASAQVIIGGSGESDVVVNWSVLDSLGRQPSLADMIKGELPNHSPVPFQPSVNKPTRAAAGPQGVVYKPYKPATKAAAKSTAKPVKTVVASKPVAAKVAESKPVAPTPQIKPAATAKPAVPAKPQIAEMAPVAAPAPVAPMTVAPMTAAPTSVAEAKGPQVSLPEVKAETTKPVEIAKPVEAPKPTEMAKPAEAPKPIEIAKPAEAPKPVVAVAPQPLLAPVPPAVPVMPPQVASLPSAETPAMSGGSDTISLVFAPEDAKVGESARSDLAALVRRLQKDEDLNLQLLAYASGDDASASKARRLSLSRALEVRKFLMDKGVRSTRIEVRALGNKQDGRGPADRVDAVLVGR